MENAPTVIFVEDNPDDLRLFRYALSQAKQPINLVAYENGRDFVEHLAQHYPAAIHFILLDLNLPVMSGFEVLEALPNYPDYRHIPVVVFTSSDHDEDRAKAYKLGANAYVSKPLELDDLCTTVQRLLDFWVNTNKRAF